MTNKTDIKSPNTISRAAVMAQLADLDRQEARVDLTVLEDTLTILNGNAVKNLVTGVQIQIDQIANPTRKERLTVFVDAINATRASVLNYITEAQLILGVASDT